jgi:hypothetical protein
MIQQWQQQIQRNGREVEANHAQKGGGTLTTADGDR